MAEVPAPFNLIRVTVHHEAGHYQEVDMEPASPVSELQAKLEKEWQMPAVCQRLCRVTTAPDGKEQELGVLEGTDHFGTYCEVGKVLHLTLKAWVDVAVKCLQDDASNFWKLTACKGLAELDRRNDEKVVHAVCGRLDDPDSEVRRAATNTLGRVAPQLNEDAMAHAAKMLEDDDLSVRLAATAALANLIEARGNEFAFSLVEHRLKHARRDVRVAAVGALCEVGLQRAENVIFVLSECLEDEQRQVQDAAVEALGLMGGRGDSYTFFTVGSRLEHPQDSVRCAAINAMAKVAVLRSEEAIAAVANCPEDTDAYAIAKDAVLRNEEAIAAVANRLEDTDARARENAASAMAVLADGRGFEFAVAQALRHLDRPSAAARCASLDALGLLSEIGDKRCVETVVARLHDDDANVRSVAAETLGKIAEKSDSHALDLVLASVEDVRATTRQAAVNALTKLASVGDKRAVDAAVGRCNDPESKVRYQAVEAVAKLTNRGDARSIAAVVARLEDPERNVQGMAAGSLARITGRSDFPHEAVSRLLEHHDPEVRRAAQKALDKAKESG